MCHAHLPAEDERPHDAVDLVAGRDPREWRPILIRWKQHVADLIYTSNVSLDGFIEDDRGSFEFSAPDDDVFVFITDLERSAGTYLYGRRMYETMAVWETDPALGAQSGLMTDFANMWQAADKVVYSTTLEGVTTARTRLQRRFDADAIRRMKESSTGHLTIAGANLAQQAFEAGLVDECRLFIRPVLVGGGKPALPRGLRLELGLIDEQRFASGVVYLRYRIAV